MIFDALLGTIVKSSTSQVVVWIFTRGVLYVVALYGLHVIVPDLGCCSRKINVSYINEHITQDIVLFYSRDSVFFLRNLTIVRGMSNKCRNL